MTEIQGGGCLRSLKSRAEQGWERGESARSPHRTSPRNKPSLRGRSAPARRGGRPQILRDVGARPNGDRLPTFDFGERGGEGRLGGTNPLKRDMESRASLATINGHATPWNLASHGAIPYLHGDAVGLGRSAVCVKDPPAGRIIRRKNHSRVGHGGKTPVSIRSVPVPRYSVFATRAMVFAACAKRANSASLFQELRGQISEIGRSRSGARVQTRVLIQPRLYESIEAECHENPETFGPCFPITTPGSGADLMGKRKASG